MLTPKPFVMENPKFIGRNHDVCMIKMTVDRKHWDFIEAMPCVEATIELNGNAIHVWLDARYDYEEAWLWIYEQLEAETREVDLGEVWGVD